MLLLFITRTLQSIDARIYTHMNYVLFVSTFLVWTSRVAVYKTTKWVFRWLRDMHRRFSDTVQNFSAEVSRVRQIRCSLTDLTWLFVTVGYFRGRKFSIKRLSRFEINRNSVADTKCNFKRSTIINISINGNNGNIVVGLGVKNREGPILKGIQSRHS